MQEAGSVCQGCGRGARGWVVTGKGSGPQEGSCHTGLRRW